jgi:hypothetical protein
LLANRESGGSVHRPAFSEPRSFSLTPDSRSWLRTPDVMAPKGWTRYWRRTGAIACAHGVTSTRGCGTRWRPILWPDSVLRVARPSFAAPLRVGGPEIDKPYTFPLCNRLKLRSDRHLMARDFSSLWSTSALTVVGTPVAGAIE